MKHSLHMNLFQLLQIRSKYFALIAFFVTITQSVIAQQATVLPGNGSFSQSSGPQGAARSQRGFYLITPKEMKASGLPNGSAVNSIGFTIGAAQDTTTKGSFKVYLQNTSDTVSRVDTAWTNVTVNTNSYTANGLVPGMYEWQVRTNCATPSPYSSSTNFTNDNLGSCTPPTGLTTTNITTTTATFNWVAPAVAGTTKYLVEYKHQDSTNYISDTTSMLSYNATGLAPNKFYQWRVRTVCSGTNSANTGASFITNAVNSCNAPGSLAVGTVTNVSAAVSWTAAAGATYYSAQYRRKGTTTWLTSAVFSTTYTFNGLAAGTTYEWQVRTVCAAGNGAFISGPNFTTTGPTACYAPLNSSTNSITDSSAVFAFDAVMGVTSYDVRFRLKDAISWTNAITPMTAVHNDSLTIPNTIGQYTIPFAGGSAFTYSGNGVYVAWEYSNTTGRLSSANTTISTTANTVVKGASGQDSIKNILSLVSSGKNNGSVLPTILTGTDQRPETRFGSPALKDSVVVAAVYALGNIAPSFITSPVKALVKNYTGSAQTYPVTLTVKEQKTNAVIYTEAQSITLASGTAGLVTFTGWLPKKMETDSLIVSIPAQANENVITNNRNFYVQNVTKSIVSYYDNSAAITQAGNDTLSGLLLTRYTMSNCGKVNAVKVYLSSSAQGHSVYAVVLNAAKTVIAQSAPFTPDSTQVNSYHTFYLPAQTLLSNEDFYVGLAQPASINGYFPVGVQYEGTDIRSNAYYRAKLNGDSLTDQPLPGRLMIGAELIAGIPEAAITGNLTLCASATSTLLTASSTTTRFADSVIAFSSQNSTSLYSADKALGSPDVFPNYVLSGDSWISATGDGRREYLTLRFSNAAPANFIDIYETYNPGAVDTVYVKNPSTQAYDVVYSGTAVAAAQTARKNRISFPLTAYNVSEVRIAINSPLVPGFNAIDAVGIGQLTTPATFASYLWTPGGETTQTKTVTTAGVYKLSVTNASGCTSTDSVTVVTPPVATVTITSTRPTTFCLGDSTILKSNRKGGNTWSTGATTDSIKVKTGGTYTVSYNDGSGCGAVTSAATVVTVNTLPVVDITGTLSFCPGGSTTLNAGAGFSSYLWSTGAISQSITVSTAGSYNVRVTNTNGCRNADTVAVTVGAALSPTIAGNLSFCPGSSTTLDAGANYTNYSWSTGATTRTITVNTASTFSVTVTNSSGCSGTTSVTTSLYAVPTPVISGNLIFCQGGSTTLNAGAGYSSYQWSTGATTQTITITTAGNYTVTVTTSNGCSGSAGVSTSNYAPPVPVISGATVFCANSSTTLTASAGFSSYNWSNGSTTASTNVSASGNYTVTVTDNNGCTGSSSVAVTQLTPPSPVITGATTFCGGNNTTLDAGAGYSSYAWNTGATTRSISVNAVGTYSVTVTDNNGCSGTASASTSQTGNIPATPGPISGPTVGICNTTGNVYSISAVPGASHYVWTVPTGATITSGQTNMVGGTSITVSYGPSFTSGNIVVAASNSCGQSGSVNPRTLAVGGTAGTPGAITGQTSGLCGQTSRQYSIAAVPSAGSYTWTVPTGATITSGQGTTTVTVNFAASFSTGSICVKSNTNCGSSAQSCITLNGLPTITGGISGPTTVCSKQDGVVYAVPAVAGATSYTWTVPAQATITAGQNTNSITVKFGTKAGTITVKANNACGSSAVQSLTITFGSCAARTITMMSNDVKVIEEVPQGLQATILPNPFVSQFTLITKSSSMEPVSIKVTDVAGRSILLKAGVAANGSHTMGENYRPGMYYLQVMQGKEMITMKLMKQ